MNAQVQYPRPLANPSSPRSSERAASTTRADIEVAPAVTEDRFFSSQLRQSQVNPLWMITAAGALLFVFLAAAVAFG